MNSNISVIMTVHNEEKYLKDSIESILNQTYTEFELIIVNDASTDNSYEIIKSYKDPRVKLYDFDENRGVGVSTNFALNKAAGKYIAKADADDIYDSKRLEKQLNFLESNKDIAIVGTFIDYFTNDETSLKYINAKQYLEKQINSINTVEGMNEKLYWFCCLINSTTMGKSEIIKKFKYGNSRIAEDYKLFYFINKLGYKITNINEKLSKIRIHNESITANMVEDSFDVVYDIKKEEIEFVCGNKKPIYIWGAGGTGKGIYKILKNNDYNVIGFLDSDIKKIGTKVLDLSIFNPKEVLKLKDINIIVASEPGRFEIVDYLKGLGYVHLENFLVF